jgi:uncharacterized protein HemX
MSLTSYIGIALGAALLAALAIGGWLYKHERDAREQAQRDLAVATEVNRANDAAFTELKRQQAASEHALSTFADSKAELDKMRVTLDTATKQMARSNEQFRKWIDALVDAGAVRLYNEAKRPGAAPGDGGTAFGSAASASK